MKFLFLLFLLLFSNYSSSTLSCDYYCIIDGNSLEVIESKSANEVRLVASISKIMTAIIVIEKDILFDVVINQSPELVNISSSKLVTLILTRIPFYKL
jgi:hypothetical protein